MGHLELGQHGMTAARIVMEGPEDVPGTALVRCMVGRHVWGNIATQRTATLIPVRVGERDEMSIANSLFFIVYLISEYISNN